MNGKDAVRELLSAGLLATPETLTSIEKVGISSFLESAKKTGCLVVEGKETAGIGCSVRGPEQKKEITPEDVIRANTEKYEKIREMLLKKVDAVSIVNIGKVNTKLSVIGMVNKKTAEGFVIEDGTGEIEVRSDEKALLDDVVAVTGWVRENTLFSEEVTYPDIPIRREVSTMAGTVAFREEHAAEEGTNSDVVITPLAVRGKDGSRNNIPNPAWVFLEGGDKKITVLVYVTKEALRREEAVGFLKKRYIGVEKETLGGNSRVLEDIPDILCVFSESKESGPWSENYKGVTVLFLGNGHSAKIDLNTRKVEMCADRKA